VRRRAAPAAGNGVHSRRLRGIHLPFVPSRRKGGEFPNVSEVKVREGETFESALRRFNKKIKQNGILSEVRRREHYEKPSVRRKRKLVAAKKRRLKAG
jgi:small subunit ribosomal protein S21